MPGGTRGARRDKDGVAVALGAGVRDLCPVSCVEDLRCEMVIKARSEQSNGRGRRAVMALSAPWLTISAPLPATCARPASQRFAGRGAK